MVLFTPEPESGLGGTGSLEDRRRRQVQDIEQLALKWLGWLMLSGVVLLIVHYVFGSRQTRIELLIVSASADTIVGAIAEDVIERGAVLTHRAPTTVTITRYKGPEWLFGCFLLLFGIIPGLLYFLFAGKTRTTYVSASPSDVGSRIVISGDDREVQDDLYH